MRFLMSLRDEEKTEKFQLNKQSQGEAAMTATREKLTLRWRETASKQAVQPVEREEYIEVSDEAVAAKALVKAIQIQPLSVDPWSPPDPLDVCLETWKSWMCRSDGDLGTQRQKFRSVDDDDDEDERKKDSESVAAAAAQRRDNEIAEATDAAIEDLRSCDRWAIYKMMGISSVWNFPLLDFMHVAQRAKNAVEKNLRENIATRALFG
jgi:hypothetical protein